MKKTLNTVLSLLVCLVSAASNGQEAVKPWQPADEFEYREFKGPQISPLIHLSCEIQKEIVYVGKIVPGG